MAGLIAAEAEKEKGGNIKTEELWPGRWREREGRERGAAGSSRGWGLAPGIEGACRDLLADQQ